MASTVNRVHTGTNSTADWASSLASRYGWLLIFVAGTLAYANSFAGPFIFDDLRGVIGNWRVTEFSGAETVRPLVHLSFALNYAVSGHSVADYHLTNLVIHLIAGLALFGVTRRALMHRGVDAADALSLVVALLWTVHPLQTGAVTYMVQRAESLMGMFFMLTLYCAVRSHGHRPLAWSLLAIVLCAAGMATKQVMVAAPLVVIALDLLVMVPRGTSIWPKRIALHLGLMATWGVLVGLYLSLPAAEPSQGLFISPLGYLATQVGVIVHYLRLSLVPVGQCLDYIWQPADSVADVLLPGLVLVPFGLAGVWGLICRRAWAFPILAFFLVLGVTSSVIPVADFAFEHRMYVPLAGILVLLVLGVHALLRSPRLRIRAGSRRAIATALWVLGALSCMGLTAQRNIDYRSELAIWLNVLETRPWNPRARLGAAEGLIGVGEYVAAMSHCEALLEQCGDYSTVSADQLTVRPDDREAYIFVQNGRRYARSRRLMARILFQAGRPEESVLQYDEALRLFPDDFGTRNQRGLAFYVMEREGEAVEIWLKTILDGPEDLSAVAGAHAYLCHAYLLRGDHEAAILHGAEAMRRGVLKTSLQLDLATAQAMAADIAIREPTNAYALAKAASVAAGGRSVRALTVLAAAEAGLGRFDDARRTIDRAVRHARSSESPSVSLVELSRQRDLYATGQVFRPARESED